MLTVAEAQARVLEQARPLPPEVLPLVPAALGCVLAEDVVSDVDMPPHDKSVMDGYAVRHADLPDGKGVLRVVEEVLAGSVPRVPVGPGQCTRIMTGAPLPTGADAVVMVEYTRALDGGQVTVEDAALRAGQNIAPRGQELTRGAKAVSAGAVLRPQEFGVLAAVGRTSVRAHPVPAVAVLSTGDELVELGTRPGPGQIRNSNGPMLAALAARAGCGARPIGIAPDNVEGLRTRIREGLAFPVLVLSGGVSAGKRDLVPGVLQDLGVQAHFHQVAMKPGKPVFFGSREGTLVFGLPGNPVSSLVCFELFVRPALRRLQGHADAGPRMVSARLTEDYAYRTGRPTYHPAQLEMGEETWQVRAVPWAGSADLPSITAANAFVLLPAGDHVHRAGTRFPVLAMER